MVGLGRAAVGSTLTGEAHCTGLGSAASQSRQVTSGDRVGQGEAKRQPGGDEGRVHV